MADLDARRSIKLSGAAKIIQRKITECKPPVEVCLTLEYFTISH